MQFHFSTLIYSAMQQLRNTTGSQDAEPTTAQSLLVRVYCAPNGMFSVEASLRVCQRRKYAKHGLVGWLVE